MKRKFVNIKFTLDKSHFITECGNVYSDYAIIPFEMAGVRVQTSAGVQEIADYEELKVWWNCEE